MSEPELIRYAAIAPMPWKNGRGITREILSQPDPAGRWPFRYRVSRAEISDAAPFSLFPGVRRWLVLAQGGALELRFADRLCQLDRIGDHCAFSGEEAVEGVPIDGASEDFNLMLADPDLDAEILLRPMVGSMVLYQPADTALLFHLLDGRAAWQGHGRDLWLGDTLHAGFAGSDRLVARLDGGGLALIITLKPRSAA